MTEAPGASGAHSPIAQFDPYDDHLYEVDVCTRFRGKVPPQKMGELNNSFERQTVTPREHARLIKEGYTTTNPFDKTTPAGGKSPRLESNVTAVWFVCLDFDTEDRRSALGTLINDPFLAEHACIIHPTASHSADRPRARVIFIFEEAQTVDQGRRIIQYLQHLYPYADQSTSDMARLWFGSPDCIIHGLGNLVTADTAAAWEFYAPVADDTQREGGSLPTVSNGNGRRAQAYAQAALQDAYQTVANTPDGRRNSTLFAQAVNLYELANSGIMAHGDVTDTLTAAAAVNGLIADDGAASVDATIASARRKAGSTARHMPEANHLASNGHTPDTGQPGVAEGMPYDYHRTDLGNAERLADRHGHNLKYNHTHKQWLIWDGQRWAEDANGEAVRLGKETARSILAEASTIEDTDKQNKLVKHAMSSQSRTRIDAMLALAQSEPAIAATPENFDRDRFLLTVANGTLDLRTGQLGPHMRQHLITRAVHVNYLPDAPAPTWSAFLDRIFDGNQELIGFMQRAIGYTLTGDAREQCIFFCHGRGRNGKSTLLDAMGQLLGDHHVKMGSEALMLKRANVIPTEIARLAGARLATSAELNEGRSLDESIIKDFTGGELITARFLYGREFTFRPEAKLWISGNHKPRVRGSDDGIWRRMRLIPFNVQIPEDEVDKQLPAKLADELPGILTWAVRGCLDWQANGLQEPEIVRTATAQYRSEEDEIGAFLDEYCDLGDSFQEGASRLYHAYKELSKRNGERGISLTAFGRKLDERGIDKVKVQTVTRLGVQLNEAGGELADAWKVREGG